VGKAVIVFSFEEPTDGVTFPRLVKKAKELFRDEDDVRIHAAIKDAADEIYHILTSGKERQSNLLDHAKRELSYLNNDEDFNDSIISSIREFTKYGHSGGSASVAIEMIHDLLRWKNLTPLTDNPDEWNKISNEDTWQSRRNPEAFSNDGGHTYYLLSEGATQMNPVPLHESASYSPPEEGEKSDGGE
jgi:hypothetical protein